MTLNLSTTTASALLDFKLRHTFLTTFRTFAPASEIFDLLLERFDLNIPQLNTDAEVEEWRTKRLLPTQRRILAMFKTWLQEHEMIEDDPPIAHRLQDFLSEVLAGKSGNETLAALAGEVMKTLGRLVRNTLYSNANTDIDLYMIVDICCS